MLKAPSALLDIIHLANMPTSEYNIAADWTTAHNMVVWFARSVTVEKDVCF